MPRPASRSHLDSTEAKFQISFKSRLWTTDDRRWGAWVGYTQQNQWQVYNDDISRPFRETNYMPEVFISYRPGIELPGGFQWRLVNAGYNHQSNGRTDTVSRSWDRLFAEFGVEKENLALFAKVWYRLPESATRTTTPTSPTTTATASSPPCTAGAATASARYCAAT